MQHWLKKKNNNKKKYISFSVKYEKERRYYCVCFVHLKVGGM